MKLTHQTGTVLVVEDDQPSLIYIEEVLESRVERVICTENGQEAIEIASNEPIDLILLDWVLPDVEGITVCKHLKKDERTKGIPIIFITGKSDGDSISKAFKAGAIDYIAKPYSMEELIARVQNQLELSASKKQLEQELLIKRENQDKLKEAYLDIEKSNEKYQKLAELLPQIVLECDKNGVLSFMNKNGLKHFGYTESDLETGLVFKHLIVSSDMAKAKPIIHGNTSTKTPPEFRFCKKDGSVFTALIYTNQITDENENPIGLRGILIDTTELREIEQAAKKNENRFRTVLENGSDAILFMGIDGGIIELNKKAVEVSGYNKEELTQNATPNGLLQDFTGKSLDDILNNINLELFDSICWNKSGEKFYLENNITVLDDEGTKSILVISRDITERKLFELRVRKAIIETEERERNRFAQDLHDDTGALLSAIKMYLNALHQNKTLDDDIKERLTEVRKMVSSAADSARNIANNIKPNNLIDSNLQTSIKSLCERFEASGQVSFSLSFSDIDGTIPGDLKTVVYRITCELINNTVKHANATIVKLNVAVRNTILSLKYSDNGKGFDMKTAHNKDTMGLLNIKSRIESLNGEVVFRTAIGDGFSAHIHLPIGHSIT